MNPTSGKSLLLFDGFCHLCNQSVKMVLRFDKKRKFVFSPLSGRTGIYWKKKLSIPNDLDSIILVEDEKYFSKSDAALRIAKKLGGVFYLSLVLFILPKKIRDQLYDWIAHKRYDWFGKRETCMLPDPKNKDRFI